MELYLLRHVQECQSTWSSTPRGNDDEDWEAIDSQIKFWFYSTCDANLLQIITNASTLKPISQYQEGFLLHYQLFSPIKEFSRGT